MLDGLGHIARHAADHERDFVMEWFKHPVSAEVRSRYHPEAEFLLSRE